MILLLSIPLTLPILHFEQLLPSSLLNAFCVFLDELAGVLLNTAQAHCLERGTSSHIEYLHRQICSY